MEIFLVEFKIRKHEFCINTCLYENINIFFARETRFFFSQFEIGYKVDLSLSTHTRIKIES